MRGGFCPDTNFGYHHRVHLEEGLKTLMPFQELGRDFLAMRTNAILADDMGLGKTLMAIEALKKLNITSGLIICPLSVRRTWVKVLEDQYPGVFIKELTRSNSIPHTKCFNIVNYDIVWRKPLETYLQSPWPVMIADEAHFLKSIEANRTKKILGKNGLYNHCTHRWLMTGTPVLNRPKELYAILRSLTPERLGEYRDYYKYAYKFCAAYRDTFGFNADGASNLGELANLLGPVMLRRMKEDVLEQIPEITYEKIYLDPSNKLRELTEREHHIAETQVASLRHALGLLKVIPAITHLEELLTSKNKVVVFTWHKEVAHGLKEHFKERAVMYTGEENVNEKEKSKTRFVHDATVNVFIGQLEASGVGVDGLQEICDTCVFVEMHSVPGKIKQAVDRLRRIGQANPVLAQFLVAEDSIDEKTVNALAEKGHNIKKILNEKGGPKFVHCTCAVCKSQKEIAELKRVDGLSVCKVCEKLLEVL